MRGFLGIDVSKGYSDFVLIDENHQLLEAALQFDDTRKGHTELTKWIEDSFKRHQLVELYCAVESTGGLEDNWYSMLVGLSSTLPVKVARLNPSVVKNAAKAELNTNVTDAISARNICTYLSRYREKVDYKVQDKKYSAYRGLHNHIALLTKQKTQLINEMKQLLYRSFPELQRYCKKSIPTWVLELLMQYPSPAKLSRAKPATVAKINGIKLSKASQLIEKATESVASRTNALDEYVIGSMAEDVSSLQKRVEKYKVKLVAICSGPEVKLLQTMKGIGAYSAAVIMIQIEDIERFPTPASLACYFGLHPVLKQSGDKKAVSRMSKQGRPALRAALYMCAHTAVVYDKHMKAIYARHRAKGNHHRQGVGVIMHKMLRVIWGMLMSKTEYDPKVDQANQTANCKAPKEAEINELEAKRRLQAFDEDAPISRIAQKKRKVHAASQSGEAGTVRDLEHAPAV